MSVIALVTAATVLALFACVAALITVRRWREETIRDLAKQQQQMQRHADLQREWLAVLAHELRTPVSAVTGYAELLADGALGSLDERALDVARRIGIAAEQLLRIVEGIEDMGTERAATTEQISIVPLSSLVAAAMDAVRPDAESRNVRLETGEHEDISTATRADHALRALILALGAALKVSSGATLTLSAERAEHPQILIAGSLLDPERDAPDAVPRDDTPRLTGAALRLGLAHRSAAFAGGSVSLHGGASGAELRLRLPSLDGPSSIDSAEDSP